MGVRAPYLVLLESLGDVVDVRLLDCMTPRIEYRAGYDCPECVFQIDRELEGHGGGVHGIFVAEQISGPVLRRKDGYVRPEFRNIEDE